LDDQKAVSAYTMTIDAYQALRRLADDPRIDAKKIAVIGWSKGGLAADLSSRTWYQVHLSRNDLRFAAHAAFYPWCGEQPVQPQQTGAPLLYLLGERDDWTGAETCLRYAERLRDSGYTAYGVVYPGAHHGFDHRGTFLRVVPQAESLSGCAYLVQTGGFRDIRSGEIRDWSSFETYLADCGRKGAHVGSNARARNAAWHDLLLFLSQVLD
jgi:dienelactone hydrolase